MASTPSRQQDYITEAREAARKVWFGWAKLQELQPEWNAQDFGSTLADGTGANEGVSAAAISACVFETSDAIKSLIDAGHGTNLTNVL